MSYKQMDNNFSFTDLSLADSLEHKRSVSRMEKINAIINWSSVESLQGFKDTENGITKREVYPIHEITGNPG